MHLLTLTHNNYEQWASCLSFSNKQPRMPLCYALGGAFLEAGHKLAALELTPKVSLFSDSPFSNIYRREQLSHALDQVDVALFWGGNAQKALFSPYLSTAQKRKILYLSYFFSTKNLNLKKCLQSKLLEHLSKKSLGMVFMTCEQALMASNAIGDAAPIIRFRCGIDTAFYQAELDGDDIAGIDRRRVDQLMEEPYVIMPGDELRLNQDALEFVRRTGIRLVRISQFGHKSNTEGMKSAIKRSGLEDRCIVFENVKYKFLRFLLRHACAYAGFVDSSWQPAGWTVACEALSSGLPIVLYDGLTSRELFHAGIPSHFVQAVEMGDISSASDRLAALANVPPSRSFIMEAMQLSRQNLDFSITAPIFVDEVTRVLSQS